MRIWCVFALVSAAGCAGAPTRPAAEPSADLRALRAELRRDRRTIRSLENEVALLRARLRDTRRPPALASDPASALPPAPLDPLPETLGGEAAAIPAPGADEVEVVYEGEAAAESTVRPRLEIKEATRSYRGAEPVAAVPLPAAERLPVLSGELPTVDAQLRRARAGAPPATRRPPADPRAEYQRYLDAARAGNHEYAAQGLRSFLDQHGDHELADNAQYWLAETYYARKRYPLALIEFEKVVERYPRGNKRPDALLKIGYCRALLGKRAEAVEVLRRLVRSYPASAPAGLARTKLEELQ